jgi:hypothetical protein
MKSFFWLFLVGIGLCCAEVYDFQIARVKYDGGGDWYNDPEVIPNLADELRRRANVNAAPNEAQVELDDPELFRYPILYLTGHGNMRLSEAEVEGLRTYLESGGFLYADDDYGIDTSFRREMDRVLPGEEWRELPFDHPVYHVLYDFPDGVPKIHEHQEGPPRAYGRFVKGRLAVLYTFNTNVSDGWTDAHDDSPETMEKAFRFGVNIILYALGY